MSQKNEKAFKEELNSFVQQNNVPGAVLAVKRQDEPFWIGAAGKLDVENNLDMLVCSQFRIGSITKVFVAAVILKLQEQGKLKLDNKITQLLPGIQHSIPQAELITLRMLLNHTSGLVDPKNDDPAYLAFITNYPNSMDSLSVADRLYKYVYDKPLMFTPGTQTHYSNTGYWLLGLVIERTTRKPVSQVMNEMIFRPQKMNKSYYDERLNPQVSQGYHFMDSNRINVTKWDKADGDGDPSSGIISTAEDLFKFSEALFSGKLLKKQSLAEMLVTVKEYGLGIEDWPVGDIKGYGKNGSSIGYEANWIYLPEKKMTMILFANRGGGTKKDFVGRMVK